MRPQTKIRPGVREKLQTELAVTRATVTLQRGDVLVPMDPRSANALYQEEEWNWLQPGAFPVFPVVEP